MDIVDVYYLVKGRSITLRFRDNQERTFSPSARVPYAYVDNLLGKQITIGGCCGKPSRTVSLFATKAQLESGERTWIE